MARGPIQFMIFIAICFILFFFSLSRAPLLIQKLLPEGPSSCKTALNFTCGACIPAPIHKDRSKYAVASADWSFDAARDGGKYGLSESQCDAAFPGLFAEIEESVRKRRDSHVTWAELQRESWPKATIRAMVYDSELYILGYTQPTVRASRHQATLHAIHRAIVASQTPLPDVEFALSIDDFADNPDDLIWSFTRKAGQNNTWLMPDFGFWGWPEAGGMVGSWTQTRRRMQEVESHIGQFANKIPKAFWRGNVAMAKRLRQSLLDMTKGKAWADVQGITWGQADKSEQDQVSIEDHCKYMFVVHTEGNSYSGRLKYLQNCRSVIFAHTMQWVQPFEYLMVAHGPKQNFVQVQRDFADLEQKIEYYLAHPHEAERIANNSVETFRDRYLTPAAEACYWRKLIRGWSEVSFEPSFYDDATLDKRWRGTPFENYALRNRQDFLHGVDT